MDKRIDHVSLCQMDATRLAFQDTSLDAVYAPYLVNVVQDPVAVARELTPVAIEPVNVPQVWLLVLCEKAMA